MGNLGGDMQANRTGNAEDEFRVDGIGNKADFTTDGRKFHCQHVEMRSGSRTFEK